MGCLDTFCALCGGPLSPMSIWDSLRSPDPQPDGDYWDYNQNLVREEDLEWLRDVRLLGEWQNKADQHKHAALVRAEVYYASEFDACMGPFDATSIHGVTHWCYAFAPGENEGYYPGNHYVMHSACLLITKHWLFERGKTIQDLYNALRVYELNEFIGVYLPDQHYGAEYFWEQFWRAEQGWEFLVKDPVNVPDMTEYILSKLRPVPAEIEKQPPTNDEQLSMDDEQSAEITKLLSNEDEKCFHVSNNPSPPSKTRPTLETHPPQSFQRICAYLPLASILSLRLTCHKLRSHLPLDQDFYRKQILSGHLLAMQDLDLSLISERWDDIKDKDWRRLARTLTRYENFFAGEESGGSGPLGEFYDAPIGLKNRMRVLKIIQGIFVDT